MSGVTRHPRLAPQRSAQQHRRNVADAFTLVWMLLTLAVIAAAYFGVWPS